MQRSNIDTSIIFQSISLLSQFNLRIDNLPRIIILGEQNQGKSSLIEAVTQVQILPKAEGLSTKKPINITLINNFETKILINDKCFDEVSARDYIEKLNSTSTIDKINCTVLAPHVYNCNMVDTIGLIKISEEDSNLDPKKIKDSVIEYLKDKNNIFVLVSSATLDLANSQMLQLIKKYNRTDDTLGVLTKIDLTENQNTNLINDILDDKIYKLGYGWIVTKLRSDRDIRDGITIEQSLSSESSYFQNRPFKRAGIIEIRKMLSLIQFDRIKYNLPEIINEIKEKIYEMKSSQTFLEKIINENDTELASKLKSMIEKLVDSSYERSQFENDLKTNIKSLLLASMEKVFDRSNVTYEIKISEEVIDPDIYHHNVQKSIVAADIIKNDDIHEMLNSGLISPIHLDCQSIKNAYIKESQLAILMSAFVVKIDDPLNKKKMAWIKYLERYFSSLQNRGYLQNKVYEITEKMLISYVNNANDDEITKKFTEYIIREIGQKAFEDKMRYSIETLINNEQRPNVKMFEIIKQIIKITLTDHLDYAQFCALRRWLSAPNSNKIEIELYSELWNAAYLRDVIDRISFDCYRIVSVNLVNKMVENLLTKIIGLNKETSQKENEEINEKIQLLNETKYNFEQFLNF